MAKENPGDYHTLLVRPTKSQWQAIRKAAEIDARNAGYPVSVSRFILNAALTAAEIKMEDN